MIAALIGAAALTGCSSSGTSAAEPSTAAAEQSVADACASATSTLTSVQTDVMNAQAEAQGSEGEAKIDSQITLYEKISASVKSASESVTNTDVKSTLTELAGTYDHVVTAAQAVLSTPDDPKVVEALQTAGADVSTAMTAYTQLCGS